ncbi:hypothetical protein GCM10027065_23510 [Rhodanobacter koreensis]
MAASCIRRNQVVDWKGLAFRLIDHLPSGDWELRGLSDGSVELLSHDELLAQYRIGQIRLRVADKDAGQLHQALRRSVEAPLKLTGRAKKVDRLVAADELTVRKRLLQEARQKAELSKLAAQYPLGSAIQEIAMREHWERIFKRPAPEKLPSIATLWRWQRQLEAAGFDTRELIPKHHLKGRRKVDIPKTVAEIIQEATEEIYLTQNRKPMRDVEAEVIDRIRAENSVREAEDKLVAPPFERIKEYIQGLPEFDKFSARHGLKAALRKFRAVLKNVFAERALERVELDATKLDFIAIDDDGLPLGRPWLHVCIDVRTRCILGYYISYEPPSLASLFECLKHAVLPKDAVQLKAWGVKHDYPCHGVCETLVFDNAFENHSDALDALMDTWGGDIQWCPRRAPWYKARIERFIRTFSEQVCQILPGTTFSNILERGDYDSVANAVIRWRDLERIVAIWIVDVYHQKSHRTLQCSPAHAWRTLVRNDQLLLPCDAKQIEQVCRTPEIRRLTHKGIERFGLYWNSEELTSLRHELGSELDVRVFFNRMNLGGIGVEHPRTRDIIEVKAIAFEYSQNLTLYQHEVTRAYMRRSQPGRVESIEAWMDGQRSILEIINEARGLPHFCLPAAAARFVVGNGQRELPALPSPSGGESCAAEPAQTTVTPEDADTNESALPSVTFVRTARQRF